MPKSIRVVYVPVGAEPIDCEIEDSGAALQRLVGGYFETHGMGADIALCCNEDGVRLELAQNGMGILGPYVFIKHDGWGESVSLSDDDVSMIRAHVAAFRHVRHTRSSAMECRSFESPAEMADYVARVRFNAVHRN